MIYACFVHESLVCALTLAATGGHKSEVPTERLTQCFFNLAFLLAKLNIWIISWIQFACNIIATHQEKQDSEVRNKQSRTSKQVPTRDCLRSLSYVILRHMPTQDLRTKQNSLRMNDLSSSSI